MKTHPSSFCCIVSQQCRIYNFIPPALGYSALVITLGYTKQSLVKVYAQKEVVSTRVTLSKPYERLLGDFNKEQETKQLMPDSSLSFKCLKVLCHTTAAFSTTCFYKKPTAL